MISCGRGSGGFVATPPLDINRQEGGGSEKVRVSSHW